MNATIPTQSKTEKGEMTHISMKVHCYNFTSVGPLFIKLNEHSHSTLRAGEWTLEELEQVIAHLRTLQPTRN